MQKLLNNVSADTTGSGIKADGGSKTLSVWATSFGGGTVTIQASPDGTTWITLTLSGGDSATFTANAVRLIDRIGQGMQIRATLTGSTAPSGVNVSLHD